MTPGQGLRGPRPRWKHCRECGGRSLGGLTRHRPTCSHYEDERQVRDARALRDLRAPIITGCVLHDHEGDPLACPGCADNEIGREW